MMSNVGLISEERVDQNSTKIKDWKGVIWRSRPIHDQQEYVPLPEIPNIKK